MNFPVLFGIPGEEDREGPPKSRYFSKKDVRWLVLGLVILLIFLYPIYSYFRDVRDWHVCAGNMNAIYKAVSGYAEDHDDRFPPVALEADSTTGTPAMMNGRLFTWVSQAFMYDPKANYSCPGARDDETFPNEGYIPASAGEPSKTVTVHSSYGMYRAYGGFMKSAIDRPNQVVLFSETSNFGSESSYDPKPFLGPDKKPVPYDGFVIGWDNDNIEPDKSSRAVTRLAFRKSANGQFKDAFGRHNEGLHAITADGSLLTISPTGAILNMRGGLPQAPWAVPAFIPR